MQDKELIEQNRLEAEAWMVAADNANLVDDLANFRKGAIAAASLCRLNASRLEALVAERDQAKANLVALEDEKNAYINYVGDALGQAADGETLWDAAQRVLSERDSLRSSLARAQEELRVAEDALRRHGYHKSCDIPACNCGDQWNHGGHAVERLREIGEALPYANGKTLRWWSASLQRVQALVSAQEEIEGLQRDKQEWRQSAMELQTDLNRIRDWMKSRAYKDGSVLSVEICDLDEEAVGDWGERINAAIDAAMGAQP